MERFAVDGNWPGSPAHDLGDGRVETDCTLVERGIRLQAIARKTAFFAGSEAGGRT